MPAPFAEPPKSVLVADDESDVVDLLAILFEDEGFRVLRAYDGEQAWRPVLGFKPNPVISDVGMPRLDVVGLLRWLRHADPPWTRR